MKKFYTTLLILMVFSNPSFAFGTKKTMEKVMDMDSNKLMDMCAITQNNNVREYSLGAWVAKVIDFYSEI